MTENSPLFRRRFLILSGTILAGCSSSQDEPATPTATSEDDPLPPNESETPEDAVTTTEGEAEEEIQRPSNYRLDFQAVENEALRSNFDADQLDEDNSVFEYSTSQRKDGHNVDPEALHWYHKDDFELRVEEDGLVHLERVIESINDQSIYSEAKEDPERAPYPNINEEQGGGHWDREAYLNSETTGEAIAWTQALFFNAMASEGLPTGRHEELVAVLNEEFDRNPDYDIHAWACSADRAHARTGMVYCEEEDEMRVLAATNSNYTAGPGDNQLHPLIEDSHWFQEENDELGEEEPYNTHHPLRFHTDRATVGTSGFVEAKNFAGVLVTNIATIWDDAARNQRESGFASEPTVGLTNNLLEEFSQTIREYNQNDSDFSDILDAANIMEKYRRDPGNYVFDLGEDKTREYNGDLEVYEVEDRNVIDDTWVDDAGDYNNFGEAVEGL